MLERLGHTIITPTPDLVTTKAGRKYSRNAQHNRRLAFDDRGADARARLN